jgi:outer membrane protein TolC
MKHFGVISFFFLTGLVAGAQTNAVTGLAHAMSLSDCIQEAMQHNLDLQIQRYNPQFDLYNVYGAYGGYDPTFNMSGQHNYNESGGSFENGQHIAGSEYNADNFSSSFNGTLPWGTIYDLGGNVSSTKGASSATLGGTNYSSPFQQSSGQVGALTLTQPLLKNFWIDETRLNVRVAKNRLQYSEQGVRGQIITSVTAVENAYYELIYAEGYVMVQQEALDLAQTQLDQDRQRVEIKVLAERGGTIEQDEAQVATSKANLIAAENTQSMDENTLKSLLTDDYARWHDILIQPTETLTATEQLFDLQDSWNKGMTERPDLLQARLNVEQQGIQLKYFYNQLYPSLDLIGSYGYNGSGDNFGGTFNEFDQANAPFWSYGAQLSMPLSNVGARNTYKAGKVTLKQLLVQLKQLEQNIMVEIDNAVKQAQSSYESVQATQQASIYAETALDAEQKKYDVGKSTTFTVLQLQNNLTAARAQEIRSLADYNEALANLAAQEGSTLERDGIHLDPSSPSASSAPHSSSSPQNSSATGNLW